MNNPDDQDEFESKHQHDFEREMEIRMRSVEARGEAAITRVNRVLKEITARITEMEKKMNQDPRDSSVLAGPPWARKTMQSK